MISEDFTLIEIIFEVCSAFGSVGLSLGITAELSEFGKVVIMILMFIGRVGITSLLFLMGKRIRNGKLPLSKRKNQHRVTRKKRNRLGQLRQVLEGQKMKSFFDFISWNEASQGVSRCS